MPQPLSKKFYKKPFLSFEDQANLLISRGMRVKNRKLAETRLAQVGYYRLSAYWYGFRKMNPDYPQEDSLSPRRLDCFEAGTDFSAVWLRYRFDRKLRLAFLDAIERIEVFLRSLFISVYAKDAGAFAYAAEKNFPKWKNHAKTLNSIRRISRDSNIEKHEFLKHFRQTYRNRDLPLWIAVELMDYGTLTCFIRHLQKEKKEKIADALGLERKRLDSWLIALNTLRNACAHHARVWNATWGFRPSLPDKNKFPAWHSAYCPKAGKWVRGNAGNSSPSLDSASSGMLLFVCRYLLRITAPQSKWRERTEKLLSSFEKNGIPLQQMGLPEHWQEHPLWK